jgi:peptidoglycan-associated lipoprotein
MTGFTRCSVALLATFLLPAAAGAQTRPGNDGPPRPASGTTFLGDTGLWFVPSADILPAGVLNVGIVAGSEPRALGAQEAAYGAFSIARGFGGRMEGFATWQMTTGIEDRRGRGDLLAGAKVGLLSESRGLPLGLAARGVVKLPTGNETIGASTGKPDLLTDVVATRQLGRAEVTASTGVVLRGDPDGVGLPTGLRSGVGVALMPSSSLRVFTEVHGERYRGNVDGLRLVSAFDTPPTAAAGLSWTVAERFSATVGINRAVGGREDGRGVRAAVRIGYRPGARRSTPLTSAAPAPTAVPTSVASPPPPSPPGSTSAPATAAGGARSGFALDDVLFDLDRAALRPDALARLDRAVAALGADPTLRLQLDGHTCELGTGEYNLALGTRRAVVVRDYLISRGIAADRLQMTSYGEEHPKHSLATEATRALNRRVEMRALSAESARR